MNYRLLFYSLLALGLVQCDSEPVATSGDFTISGTLLNAPDGIAIYLHDPYLEENIDSTTLEANMFTFTADIAQPQRLKVIYDGPIRSYSHIVWVENTEVTIEANWEEMAQAELKGGREQSYAMEVDQAMDKWGRDNSLPYESQALYDLDHESIRELYDYRNAQRMEFWLPLIIDRADSYFAVETLYKLREQIDREVLKDVMGRMSNTVQESKYGKSLSRYLERPILQVGDQFEDYPLTNLDGEEVMLSELVAQGKPILMVFGALSHMYQGHRNLLGNFNYLYGNDVNVVGYVVEHNMENFLADTVWDSRMPLYTDFGTEHSPYMIRYGVTSTPTTIVIDADGKIQYQQPDYSEAANLVAIGLASTENKPQPTP